jgi:hypothetical protein
LSEGEFSTAYSTGLSRGKLKKQFRAADPSLKFDGKDANDDSLLTRDEWNPGGGAP